MKNKRRIFEITTALVTGFLFSVMAIFIGCTESGETQATNAPIPTGEILSPAITATETTFPAVPDQTGEIMPPAIQTNETAFPVIPDAAIERGLTLSDMIVRVTSQGRVATFQLYDTVAAFEFYRQLPLELALTNFRDAQWMFFLPQRLNVTPQEAYHQGIRGELSYYEPWGNAFMLYRDFYARDQMHRLGLNLTGLDEIAGMSGIARIERYE
ncbi:MAG: cyclophilin-like fold protein [Spirochaetes bacterium]|nr:cyclophilin-like fold protein [Spirochaetota bacterium]